MSVSLIELWLPILLSGLFCWIVSALIHMVIKYHNSDYKKLNNEKHVAEALRTNRNRPGFYTLPHCNDMSEMNDPDVRKQFNEGPVALITVMKDGLPPMGKLLSQQLVFFIIGSLFIAYISILSLSKATDFIDIFRLVFVTGFVCFGWASIPYSIWFGHPWSATIKYLVDAVVYSAVIAATFAWLWPSAV